MTYRAMIVQGLERSAEWRRDKAKQYPEDAERNHKAALLLEGLARAFDSAEYDADLFARYVAAMEDEDTLADITTAETELLAAIGFRDFPTTANDMLELILLKAGVDIAPEAA